MKNLLRISLCLNILLGVLVLFLIRSTRPGPVRAETAAAPVVPQPGPQSAPAEETPVAGRQEFRWNQVEASDYRTYIANLRRIGCPEQTIRDIITADVDNLYTSGRTGAVARLNPDRDPWQQRNDESSLISSLLDPQPSTLPDNANLRALRLGPRESVMPLVWQNVDLALLNLSPDQIDRIYYLRQKFQEEMAGGNADPGDAAYRQRWQKAQSESDSLLLGTLGSDSFNNYQTKVTGLLPGTQ